MGEEKQSFAKSLLLVIGFITVIAGIAAAVYGGLKYFENKKTEEFMDYYFDEDDYLEEDEIPYEQLEEETEE